MCRFCLRSAHDGDCFIAFRMLYFLVALHICVASFWSLFFRQYCSCCEAAYQMHRRETSIRACNSCLLGVSFYLYMPYIVALGLGHWNSSLSKVAPILALGLCLYVCCKSLLCNVDGFFPLSISHISYVLHFCVRHRCAC
ncbi:hypothetical protein ANPL_03245 [Anaplasma platys]|uniref:Uncharacterized protein n=1 Tax=Anaplasma platys TaxID=949 RepID=A0A858PYR2_9RICK|nr:hypothetical protein ANPL_03245 [Anaplasma platys]